MLLPTTTDQKEDVIIYHLYERKFMFHINSAIEMMKEPAEYITQRQKRLTIHDLKGDASTTQETTRRTM
jgi:hypothetical protein